jgi:hypothetical protein
MNSEQLISLTDLAAAVGVTYSTIWRWAVHGVGGVRLENVRRGARIFSTRALLDEFQAQLSAALNHRAA